MPLRDAIFLSIIISIWQFIFVFLLNTFPILNALYFTYNVFKNRDNLRGPHFYEENKAPNRYYNR